MTGVCLLHIVLCLFIGECKSWEKLIQRTWLENVATRACENAFLVHLRHPRLNVFRSLNHIYAQVIDDTKGITLASASSVDTSVRGSKELEDKSQVEQAKVVGKLVAERALGNGDCFGCF